MTPVSGKRKRGGGKSTSMTPSLIDDDDDDRDTVSDRERGKTVTVLTNGTETSQDEA